ncbi:hypothetical protein [uncultured Rikenella sp.]|uniref:hypothetical protein n=1 Tax=uncultured Rikenella sp. TaxID=368003 RepID=UPI00272A3378|nr:hypothetical protein [uncultured Rikenella sp.]
MKAEILREGLRRIERVEEAYERLAKMLEPEGLEEDLLPLAKGCMAALRGLERCVEMRLKLAREEERGRAAEPEVVSEGEEKEGERAVVDWSRLSDGALREVEEALVPCERRARSRGCRVSPDDS